MRRVQGLPGGFWGAWNVVSWCEHECAHAMKTRPLWFRYFSACMWFLNKKYLKNVQNSKTTMFPVKNFHSSPYCKNPEKCVSLPSLSVKTWFLNFSHLPKWFSSQLPTSFPSLAIAGVGHNPIFYWWFGVISKTYCPIAMKQERYLPLIQVGPDNYVFVFSSPWV